MKKPSLSKSSPRETFPAFAVRRVPGGWAYIRFDIDVDDFSAHVAEISEPDTKPITTEKFKVEVGKYWSKIDGQKI